MYNKQDNLRKLQRISNIKCKKRLKKTTEKKKKRQKHK